jgi:hypothetical protein
LLSRRTADPRSARDEKPDDSRADGSFTTASYIYIQYYMPVKSPARHF